MKTPIAIIASLFLFPIFTFSAQELTPFVDTFVDPAKSAAENFYFPASYEESRENFLKTAVTLRNELPKTHIESFQMPSQKDPELFVDALFVPAKKESKKLIILMTGVHGGEAYTANAVLSDFFLNTYPHLSKENTGLIAIHGLNPYGFKYFRRVTENNVDLNRNMSEDDSLYANTNPSYDGMISVLNEEAPLKVFSPHNWLMLPRLVWLMITKSKAYILQATAGGQYQHDTGLFFGGKQREPQIDFLIRFLKDKAQTYPEIYYVDLHTGFGEKGKLHLFGNRNLAEDHRLFTEAVFNGERIDYGGSKDFYKTSGDSVELVSKIFPNKKVSSMCFEFGTLDSQTTLGSFKSLQTLRFENQSAHYGYASDKDQKRSQSMSVEMFSPQNSEWRKKVLEQGHGTLKKSVNQFLSL